MPRKASTIKVGIFVIVGLVLALGSIIYLGAARYLKGANLYVTYFGESVQGLQRDSVVRYLGVSVGRVVAIRVAPDSNLIEVVMDVKFKGDLTRIMVAQLKSAGITGITFVELARRQPKEEDLSPRIEFASEYPIIPSKPSEITRILSVIDKVAKQFDSIDFAGMAAKLDGMLTAGKELMTDPRIKQTLAKVAAAAAHLESLAVKAESTLVELKVSGMAGQASEVLTDMKETLNQGKKVLSEVRSLIPVAKKEIKSMDLPGTTKKAREFVDGLSGQSEEFLTQANLVSENLLQASRVLERLLQKLEMSPSQLIFSRPPPPREVGP